MKRKLEICCYTVEAALLAARSGADRIELCDNSGDGGTTPSWGTLMVLAAQENLRIPIMVMVRPRGGDFLYTDLEYDSIQQDVTNITNMVKSNNKSSRSIRGIVVGFLLPDGQIDATRTQEIVELVKPAFLEVTVHRAFDMCRDPLEALEVLKACGVTRVLTSGGRQTAMEGMDLLRQLVERAGDDIIVMPGSGVRDTNLQRLMEETKAVEFHTSARSFLPSQMQFRNHNIDMGGEMESNEYTTISVDTGSIRKMAEIIKDSNEK